MLKLGLTYIDENKEGNLCFVNNNSELRDEFKQNFTRQDVLHYINATKQVDGEIKLPATAEEFWEKVSDR